MSSGNYQFERKRNYELREKTIDTTYTVKTGRSSDNLIIDNPINIADPSADFTLTVSNGSYEGQTLLITFTSDASDKTVTVTVTTGTNYSLTAAGDFASLEWVNSTVGWAAHASQET